MKQTGHVTPEQRALLESLTDESDNVVWCSSTERDAIRAALSDLDRVERQLAAATVEAFTVGWNGAVAAAVKVPDEDCFDPADIVDRMDQLSLSLGSTSQHLTSELESKLARFGEPVAKVIRQVLSRLPGRVPR